MTELLGKGVGDWTENQNFEFSNMFGWGSSNDMMENLRTKAREIALADKKAKEEAEANTKGEDVISDENLGLEGGNVAPSSTPSSTPSQIQNKPPYLLYGGIGLVVIVGAIFIFTRK
jgi:hypothetical protein